MNRQAGLNIELKGPHTAKPVVRFIAERVKNGWDQSLFLISSFDRQALEQVRQLSQHLQIGLLTQRVSTDDIAIAQRLHAYSIHPAADRLSLHWIEKAHAHSFKVFAYTVNQVEDIRRMGQLSVDGVFTNFPERVVHLFGPRQAGWPS